MVWTIIIIILSTADQVIKFWIDSNLTVTDRITVIDRFFYIIRRQNSGAAWSFLAEPDWGIYVLAGLSLLVTALLIVILVKVKHTWLRVCLTLVIAGSIGNLIDRVRYGAVTDYLDFHFGTYIFPTFNLADMLIVCGTGLLCLLLLREQSLVDTMAAALSPKKDVPSDGTGDSETGKGISETGKRNFGAGQGTAEKKPDQVQEGGHDPDHRNH